MTCRQYIGDAMPNIPNIPLWLYLAVATTIFMAGCVFPLDDKEDPKIVIQVVDVDGKAFRADSVTWYRLPIIQPNQEYHARCLDADCKTWTLDDTLSGVVYVQAFYERPTADPYCWIVADDGRRLNLDSAPNQKVRLVMEIRMACA